MKRFAFLAVLLLVLPLSVGCADQAEPPTAPLFAAKPGSGSGEVDYPSTFSLYTSSSNSAIFGDGASGYTTADGFTQYLDGDCGVKAVVYASGDGYLQTNNPKLKNLKCPAYPRRVQAIYQGGSDDGGVVMNANNIRGITGSDTRPLSVRIDGSACDRLHFSADRGATSALVTRVDAKTWRVESTTNAAGKTTAVCEKDGSIREVGSFSFTITAN